MQTAPTTAMSALLGLADQAPPSRTSSFQNLVVVQPTNQAQLQSLILISACNRPLP